MVEHLAATYGNASLKTLLRAYGRGLETDQAFKEAFNATIDDVQKTFDVKLERDFGPLRQALKAPEVKGPVALEELEEARHRESGQLPGSDVTR